MRKLTISFRSDHYHKLKWLMFFRVIFTILLLGSTILIQIDVGYSLLANPVLGIYGIIAGIFALSFLYATIINHVKHLMLYTYIQVVIDTIIITLIIFYTGCSESIFSFLYLVVIVYSSMLLFRKGSIIVASLCSLQYAILIFLEYNGLIKPFALIENSTSLSQDLNQIVYKILITSVACFAVAFLSSMLSEQTRATKDELITLGKHVKRVEKMAVIGEMAAGLAHEIKNPLASLTGSIQLLRDDYQKDIDHNRLMNIILREADRLSSLVNEFLLFARPPVAKKKTIELDKALMEAIEFFEKDSNINSRISIRKEFESKIHVLIDPLHLRQILLNILLNASEAIENTGYIDVTMKSLRNGRASIQISDDGCGMSGDTIKSIFDPFFTTKPGGIGLGLSIVHRILESNDCQLDVESIKNQGTSFYLKLKQIE